MSSDVIISVEHLSKRYELGEIGARSLREAAERMWHRVRGRDPSAEMGVVGAERRTTVTKLQSDKVTEVQGREQKRGHGKLVTCNPETHVTPVTSATCNSSSDLWALRDVSFEVRRGEVLGIIGRNGAGKSTLLKILSRITEPTSGRAVMRGRVGSLLEVGTGFHPELTGRENIFLNGAILGMRKKEIEAKFDEIVAFAEVERFIDTPVKRYSSGMYVRLAFAVAAHLDPEILIVDEVLAVGDAAFQKKCLGKMSDVASKEGRTVLFVSHNMAAIEGLCEVCLLLEDGREIMLSDTNTVISQYLKKISEDSEKGAHLEIGSRSGSGIVRFTGFHIEDISGEPIMVIRSGQDVVFVFNYSSNYVRKPVNVSVGFSFSSEYDQTLFILYNDYKNQIFKTIPEKGSFRCQVSNFPFRAGLYIVRGRILVNGVESDWPKHGIGRVKVCEGDFFGTGSIGAVGDNIPFLVDGAWSVDSL